MNPLTLTTSIFSLITGTLITLSSSHWLLAWMGLEINTFAIMPFMTQKSTPQTLESALKYFIIQTIATTMLLFSSIWNAWTLGQWNIQQMNQPLLLTMVYIALAMKLGLAPMHAWFPEIIQTMNLPTGLILSTWQKFAPLALMLQLPNNISPTITILGLLSILMGGWGGLNQTQLLKILAYSSIAHLGWMLLVIQYLPTLTYLTFITYVILTSTMFLTIWHFQSTSIKSLSTSWSKMPVLSAIFPLMLLSLGGLPPFTGFFPKWMILLELTKQKLILTAMMATFSTLLSLYFYLRLSYTMTLTSPTGTSPSTLPWRIKSCRPLTLLAISTILSLLLLPLSPTMNLFILQ
uniref:NADH-ubiquinone oxidoreductase chain 2 n=1 Tax=Renova oscari TaxID=61834 RepID=Q9TD11_9TELE|nr:NADH dehydrogenase subunit II [Renova oscari]